MAKLWDDTSYGVQNDSPQLKMYNLLTRGGTPGARNENFFARRGRSIENAFGTTGAALVNLVDNATENRNIEARNSRFKQNMNDIYKKYGYNSADDYYNAKDEAEKLFDKYGFNSEDYWQKHADLWSPSTAGSDEVKALEKTREDAINRMSKEDADKIRYFENIQNELKGQASSNANEAKKAAEDWKDYRTNSYVGKKTNQDQGKFAGSALNTLSTMTDVMLPTAGIALNAVQGGVEGVADELEDNGFKNFDWGRAGQNALVGAVTGGVTGGLNKGLNKMASSSGNLLPNNNILGKAANAGLNLDRKLLNYTPIKSNNIAGQLVNNVYQGSLRGALSGGVGGATGAGLSAAMNGQDVLGSAAEGYKQGIKQGAMAGGIMGGANTVLRNTPGIGNAMKQLDQAGENWQKSGNGFNERLTNTLTSGDSGIGNWLQGKQSKMLASAGQIGDTIRDYTDAGMGPRKAEAAAYEDLLKSYNEERGLQGAIEDARAAGYPNDSNFQKAQRYIEGGSMAITPEDAFNDLKSVYGDSFKESTYKNKDGSWKYKNGEPYVWTTYKNKLAMNLSKAMDAADVDELAVDPNAWEAYAKSRNNEAIDNYENELATKNRVLPNQKIGFDQKTGRITGYEPARFNPPKYSKEDFADWLSKNRNWQVGDTFQANGETFNVKRGENGLEGVSLDQKVVRGLPGAGGEQNVREWYMNRYPDDELGSNINPDLTFNQLRNGLGQDDAYKQIGVGDSVVRERLFNQLANEYAEPYDTVYNKWLNGTSDAAQTPTTTDIDQTMKEWKVPSLVSEEVDRYLNKIQSGDLQGANSYRQTAEGALKAWATGNSGVYGPAPSQYKGVADDLKAKLDTLYNDRFGRTAQTPDTDKFERAYTQTRDSLKNLYPDQEITDKMVRDEIERLSFADLNESSEPSTAEAAKIARQFAQTPLRNQAPVAESRFEKAYRMTNDNLKSLYPDQDITDRMVRDEIERLYLADLNESSGISNAKAARLAKEFANTPLQNQTPDTLGGWLKKAGERIVEDANNRGVGLSIKNVGETPAQDAYAQGKGSFSDALDEFIAQGGNITRNGDVIPGQSAGMSQAQEYPTDIQSMRVADNTAEQPYLAYGESDLGNRTRRGMIADSLSRFGDTLEGAQADVTRAATRKLGIESTGKVIENVRKKTGLTNLETQAKLANELTGGENSLMDNIQRKALSASEDGKPYKVDTEAVSRDVEKIVDKYADTNMFGSQTARNKFVSNLRRDIANYDTDVLTIANRMKANAADLRGKGVAGATPSDSAKAKIYSEIADRLDDLSYNAIPKQNVNDMFDATISEMRGRAEQAARTGNKDIAKAYNTLASRLDAEPRTIAAYRSFKKDFVDVAKIDKLSGQAENGAAAQMGRGFAGGLKRFTGTLLQRPANAALAKIGGAINAGADRMNGNTGGDVPNPTGKTPFVPEYENPATQLYNAIGRTEGQIQGNQAKYAKYLADNAQEAVTVPNTGANTLEDLASTTVPTTSATSVYNTMTGTQNTQTPQFNSVEEERAVYFYPPTGDKMTDMLSQAMRRASNAKDYKALGQLYEMYVDTLSAAQKRASSSNEQEKLTDTQRRAYAAESSLNELAGLSPDLGYQLSNIPVVGNIATLGGNTYQSAANSLATQIGYMLSGANIKEDEAARIGQSYVPQPFDSEATKQSKLQRAKQIIEQYKNTYTQPTSGAAI